VTEQIRAAMTSIRTRPWNHPDQPGLVQQRSERAPCGSCGLPTYNETGDGPRCLWHHGRAGMKERR
jgi:hypothetical protein